jgi:hypothetical protein
MVLGISSSQDETRGLSEQLDINSVSMSVATNVHVTTFVCDLWSFRSWLQRDSIITFRVCKHDLKIRAFTLAKLVLCPQSAKDYFLK